MSDWQDGEVRQVQGSGAKPYKLLRRGSVYSCSCPAWTRQSKPIDLRTCKHLIAQRGRDVEEARISGGKPVALPVGVPAPQCSCHQGSTCDISHDPAVCSCAQCSAASGGGTGALAAPAVAEVAARSGKARGDPATGQSEAAARDKARRVNRFGGQRPFTESEKADIVAEEEARKGRKLRQDEKTDLFGPDLLLANVVEDDFNPTGWWVSIKKDGLRAYWNGEVFVSRGGGVYSTPNWFISALPQVPLDGELYLGRDMLEETNSIVRSSAASDGWKKITFVVFDAPAHNGPFEERLAFLQSLPTPAHVEILAQRKCVSRADHPHCSKQKNSSTWKLRWLDTKPERRRTREKPAGSLYGWTMAKRSMSAQDSPPRTEIVRRPSAAG